MLLSLLCYTFHLCNFGGLLSSSSEKKSSLVVVQFAGPWGCKKQSSHWLMAVWRYMVECIYCQASFDSLESRINCLVIREWFIPSYWILNPNPQAMNPNLSANKQIKQYLPKATHCLHHAIRGLWCWWLYLIKNVVRKKVVLVKRSHANCWCNESLKVIYILNY